MKIHDKIPLTVDGEIIYPNMTLYFRSPYSIEKFHTGTVYSVVFEKWGTSEVQSDYYYIIINENRHYNGEWWEDGNTEHISIAYANKEICLSESNKIYNDWMDKRTK
jgi:hypothetical protein